MDEIESKATRLNTRQANFNDLGALVQLRLELLREAGNLESDSPVESLAEAIQQYPIKTLPTGQFVAWIAEVNSKIVGTSGVVFFERPPVYGNLSGLDA